VTREELIAKYCGEPVDIRILEELEAIESKKKTAQEVFLLLVYAIEHGEFPVPDKENQPSLGGV